jgi:hypothetical protein
MCSLVHSVYDHEVIPAQINQLNSSVFYRTKKNTAHYGEADNGVSRMRGNVGYARLCRETDLGRQKKTGKT